jgi:hypothetical protein
MQLIVIFDCGEIGLIHFSSLNLLLLHRSFAEQSRKRCAVVREARHQISTSSPQIFTSIHME